MYSFYEWAGKIIVPLTPREKSSSLAGLKSTCHTATNPCHWVIVDGQRRIVASSGSGAETIARRIKVSA